MYFGDFSHTSPVLLLLSLLVRDGLHLKKGMEQRKKKKANAHVINFPNLYLPQVNTNFMKIRVTKHLHQGSFSSFATNVHGGLFS